MNPQSDDIVCGRWSVKEAILSGRATKVFIAQGAHGAPINEIYSLAKERRIPFHVVDRFRLAQLVRGNHQGVAAQVTALTLKSLDEVIQKSLEVNTKGARLLFFDGIQDPQNVGSILRSAAFFGVPGVVIPKWRSAALTSSVISASAGAAQFVDVAPVANLAQAIEEAKQKGLWIIGADMDGDDIKTAKVPTPFALVLGSEGEGLRQLTKKKCDGLVSIKKQGRCPGLDSLNVGCACAILLHALA